MELVGMLNRSLQSPERQVDLTEVDQDFVGMLNRSLQSPEHQVDLEEFDQDLVGIGLLSGGDVEPPRPLRQLAS